MEARILLEWRWAPEPSSKGPELRPRPEQDSSPICY
jgi:hypothetical protein